jgi:Cu/Ag efflux pump CusA
VPLALGLGAGAEMQQPLAIAVIGGLSFSTLFTLFFAPLLYVALRRWQRAHAAGKPVVASPDRTEVPVA